MTTNTYLFFPGCKIDRFLPQYGQSTRTVMSALNIGIEEIEFNCCGYPVRHQNFLASMSAAARNLALAAAKAQPILTPCKCCYGNLRHADHWLRQNRDLRQQVNTMLAEEGLAWQDGVLIRHLLTVLDEDQLTEAVGKGWVSSLTARRARDEVEWIRAEHEAGRWPAAVVKEWTLERARQSSSSTSQAAQRRSRSR